MAFNQEIRGGRLFGLPILRCSQTVQRLESSLKIRGYYEDLGVLPGMRSLRGELGGKLDWVFVTADGEETINLGKERFWKLPSDPWRNESPPALLLEWDGGFLRVEASRHQRQLLFTTGVPRQSQDKVYLTLPKPQDLSSSEWALALNSVFLAAKNNQSFIDLSQPALPFVIEG